MSHAVVVANASVSVGGGHLRRCMVLGDALASKGWTVVAALRDVNFAQSLSASAKIQVAVIEEYTSVTLVPGTNGTFEIHCDGELAWERKRDGGFPDVRQLKQLIRDRIDPDRSLGHLDRSSDPDTGATP